MSEIFSLDGINYAKEVANPFPIGGSIREEIKDTVVRYGVLRTDTTLVEGSKEKIADYYDSNKRGEKGFGDFLCEHYCQNRYCPVTLMERDDVPYAPYDLLYNQAGIQYKFRDKNRRIHLECIGWSEVARRIGRMIRHKEYFSDIPLAELRKNRNRDYER